MKKCNAAFQKCNVLAPEASIVFYTALSGVLSVTVGLIE